jgi:hypothetical protein
MGFFYGHNLKVKILEVLEDENLLIVENNNEQVSFDLISGFESNKIQYSGYQLDINSINIVMLADLTDNATYEFGKV